MVEADEEVPGCGEGKCGDGARRGFRRTGMQAAGSCGALAGHRLVSSYEGWTEVGGA